MPFALLPILSWWHRTLDIYLPNGKRLRAIIGRHGQQRAEAVVQGLLPEDDTE